MFEALSPDELRQVANEIAYYADEQIIAELYHEQHDDDRNTYEDWPGVVTYHQQ